MKKRITATLVALIMTLVVLAPISVQAAGTSPYCRISYDANLGLTTVKYYSYSNGIAKFDASRLIKIDGSTLRVGTSNTQITKNYKAGSNVTWTSDGEYVIWQKTNNILYAYCLSTGKNIKLADSVSTVNLNYDSMAETVTYSNGDTTNISTLISNSNSSNTNGNNNSSNNSSTSLEVKEYTDSSGNEIISFGNYSLKIAGTVATLTAGSKVYKLSEMCSSGVRFVGVEKNSPSYYIYLYEDADNAYYRFDTADIFNPAKMILGNGTLKSVINDKKGYVTKVVTTTQTYPISDLSSDSDETETLSYAINKSTYSTLYLANGSVYKAKRTSNGILILNGKQIATGISSGKKQFGFSENYLFYVQNGVEYKVDLTNTSSVTRVASNVTKLVTSTKNGLVNGMR